jgi:glycosyltransferase involved in cell wall biosynthesis
VHLAKEWPVSRFDVSVVIALYNKEPYIVRCVRSVLAQTAVDFEVVIVDDGSTDDGGALVAAMADPRIVLIRQENRGRSAARNRGIAAARGSLVAFLDADDEMGPGHLEALLRLRRQFPQAGLYATGYRKSFHGQFSLDVSLPAADKPGPTLIENYFALASRGIVWTGNVAVPRDILQEVGGFAVNETWGEDLDLWGRVALRYPLAYDPAVHNTYHCEAMQRTPPLQPGVVFPFIRSATAALHRGQVRPELVNSVKEYLHFQWLDLCYRAVDSGARLEALRILREELSGSRTYAKTARFLVMLIRALPVSIASRVLRLLRSRYGLSLRRAGFHWPGLTGN